MTALAELKERLASIADLDAAAAVLGWDQETYMPSGAIESRAAQLTTLARMSHEAFTDERIGVLLGDAAVELADAPYDGDDASLLRVTRRDWDRATKLPAELVARLARATSLGQQAWQKARQESSFAAFAGHLEEIVALSREKAEALGFEESIYDPLLEQYEPGMTTAQLETVFAALREQLVPIVAALSPEHPEAAAQHTPPPLDRSFDAHVQWDFGVAVMEDFGFDFERGRQDRSTHPFTTAFSATDVRVTTRIHEDFLPAGLFGTLHECGHGLYEQGVAPELARTPLADGASLGMHESQSRLWEILVGRSRDFWRHYYPLLRSSFPGVLEDVDVDAFYAAINTVCPSLIRVEADEVTYNLHVMLRFELEKDLLEERLAVADLPDAWNAGMKSYLGIEPDNDADGVLQDIHWSMGAIGYFPTYTLGNLMSAQIFARVLGAIPDLDAHVRDGDFADLLAWLQDNVYRHGRKFTANELLLRMGCGELSAEPWLAYIRSKYGELSGRDL
jgi:carboxypeptidase Taq